MHDLPLFDSLMHPMPDGGWMGDKIKYRENKIEDQLASMARHNVRWGLAVGLGDQVGGYREDRYAKFIRDYSHNLYPVAYCDFSRIRSQHDIIPYLTVLKESGYIAIKIHPRMSQISYSHPLLAGIVKEANEQGLGVLMCTYFWSRCGSYGDFGLEGLAGLLERIPDQKIVLLHGGGVRLLETAELVRHFPNTLLDLSFTLIKYEGSSIDLDIQYLFRNFDRRICLGSDSPEFGHDDLRRRFDFFTETLSVDKAENVAYRNLMEHLNINVRN